MRRADQIANAPAIRSLIERLVEVAESGLPAMFDGEKGEFVHALYRDGTGGGVRAVGESVRYGGMVALGARWLEEPAQRAIFGGATAAEFMTRALARSAEIKDIGDLAVVAWAASATGCSGTESILERLSEEVSQMDDIATVELAWCLSALVEGRAALSPSSGAESVHARLLSSFSRDAGVFPHRSGPGRGLLRGHVACFADQVYPIQALSRYHAAFGAPDALSAATRCAQQICDAMGREGQWWWHYDARNGSVIEGYPVYSVHQDAMGPMALFDLQEAGGPDFGEVIRRSLTWMAEAVEVGHSLIDEDLRVIWRKVGRAEPGKLVRTIRAGTSRVKQGLRLTPLDTLFRATRIDYECRPYHLGWVLDTWLPK